MKKLNCLKSFATQDSEFLTQLKYLRSFDLKLRVFIYNYTSFDNSFLNAWDLRSNQIKCQFRKLSQSTVHPVLIIMSV